jgi:hypothetical protein
MPRIHLSGLITIEGDDVVVGPRDFPGQQGRAALTLLVVVGLLVVALPLSGCAELEERREVHVASDEAVYAAMFVELFEVVDQQNAPADTFGRCLAVAGPLLEDPVDIPEKVWPMLPAA